MEFVLEQQTAENLETNPLKKSILIGVLPKEVLTATNSPLIAI